MPPNYNYLIPGAAPALAPFEAHRDLFQNFGQNKNPMFALNPLQRGSIANAMDSFTPHGQIIRAFGGGKGGDKKGGSAYATGEFDLASDKSRRELVDFFQSSEDARRDDFDRQIARGMENRKAAKEQELKASFGPRLEATEANRLPGFLADKAPKLVSGADRGTRYGAALEGAIARGERSVPEMKMEVGAKGSPDGIKAENVPLYQSRDFDPLTPAYLLHGQAQMQANQMNQPKKGFGGK